MRRLLGALAMATVVLVAVAAAPATAATRTVSSPVVFVNGSSPAVTPEAPSGTFSASFSYTETGPCANYGGEWTYNDGMGNTIGGRMSGPVNCNPRLPVTTIGRFPPLVVHHYDLQVFSHWGTGAFAGATGVGTLDMAGVTHTAGQLELSLTLPD